MSLTTQSQYAPTSVAAVTGTVTGLGTVTGTMYVSAGGPRVTGDTSANSYGWAMDLRLVLNTTFGVFHILSVPSAAQSTGLISQFFFINSITNNGAHFSRLCSLVNGNGGLYAVQISNNANFWAGNNFSVPVDTGLAVPLDQWFELRTAYENTGGTNFTVLVQYRICGGTTWVTIASQTGVSNGSSTVTTFQGPLQDTSGPASPVFRGRYAMPTICSMGSFSDNTLPLPSVVDPQQTPYTWFLDPINGSDTNPGTSLNEAIKTAAYATTLSNNCGFFPGRNGNDWICKADSTAANITLDATVLGALIAQGQGAILNAFQTATLASVGLSTSYAQGIIPNGDSLLIADNGGQEWRLDAQLSLNTSGMYLGPSSGDIVNCHARISALVQVNHGSWTLTSGQTAVWQMTAPYQFSCPLQNRRPLTQETSIANVAAHVGSYYSDNAATATIYVNPSGGLDPTQSANDGMMEVTWLQQPFITSASILVAGLDITGTVLSNGANAVNGYSLQMQGASCINTAMNINGSRYDKHAVLTSSNFTTNGRNIYLNINASGGNPYVGFGGQTAFGDFYNNGSGNQAYYDNCNVAGGNAMVIGSTGYAFTTAQEAYICHGTTDTEMTKVTFVDTNFNSPLMLAPSIQQSDVTVSQVTLTTGGASPFIKPGEF